jgi:hypothetical protein
MKRAYLKAFSTLGKMGVPVKEDNYGDGFLIESSDWANYWRQDWGIFGVDPRIEKVLQPLGLFAEWQNPEVLKVYKL